jgi:hypothetical protein
MLGEFGGDGRCGSRSATEAHGPVGLANSLRVELADDAQDAVIEEAPVATGDSLFGGSDDCGQATERRSRVDV